MSTAIRPRPDHVELVPLQGLSTPQALSSPTEASNIRHEDADLIHATQNRDCIAGSSASPAPSTSGGTGGSRRGTSPAQKPNLTSDVDTGDILQPPGDTHAAGDRPTTDPTSSAYDRRQFWLNTLMVVLTVSATVAVLYALLIQLADHRINQMNLDLGLWSAWMNFRDACNASVVSLRTNYGAETYIRARVKLELFHQTACSCSASRYPYHPCLLAKRGGDAP